MPAKLVRTTEGTLISGRRTVKGHQPCCVFWSFCWQWTSRTHNHGAVFKYCPSNCWKFPGPVHRRERIWIQELQLSQNSHWLCVSGKHNRRLFTERMRCLLTNNGTSKNDLYRISRSCWQHESSVQDTLICLFPTRRWEMVQAAHAALSQMLFTCICQLAAWCFSVT